MTNITVIPINEEPSYLLEVIKLGDENNATLGFFAKGAFEAQAKLGHILIALDENKILMGYLLYRIVSTRQEASITHLCVASSYRQRGGAEILVDELKKRTKAKLLRGIRLHCRKEYQASKLWPRLGFRVKGEKDGRGKIPSELICWWFDHGYPTLFTSVFEQQTKTKLVVAVDANIFFDLQSPKDIKTEESHALLADWLQDDIDICVTDEIFNEILRQPDKGIRQQLREKAYQYSKLPTNDERFQNIKGQLRPWFPDKMRESDESDLRQLARAISSDTKFFITRDVELLDKDNKIYDEFGMRILNPANLIIHLDELHRENQYQPVRLASSSIEIQLIQSGQEKKLAEIFSSTQQENYAAFEKKLRNYLAAPHVFKCYVVRINDKNLLALIVYGRRNTNELEIPFFRIKSSNPLAPTLIRYLILDAILKASSEGRVFTKTSEEYLSDQTIIALQESGFIYEDKSWVKASVRNIGSISELVINLESLATQMPRATGYFQKMANYLKAIDVADSTKILLDVEQYLWPVKITNLNIPVVMVPIRPQWAKDLFDDTMAKQTLWGAKTELILNVENVYYSGSSIRFNTPARVLWYVSSGEGIYQGTKSIRATSYIEEVIIGKPKELFPRFRRLGVYEWKDVAKIKSDIDKNILAFRFSRTELFHQPIKIEQLKQIWAETGEKFDCQWPRLISSAKFFRLYQMGTQPPQK